MKRADLIDFERFYACTLRREASSRRKRYPAQAEQAPPLTAERLRELVNYDPETGVLTWRIWRPGHSIGWVVGTQMKQGYLRAKIDGRMYLNHRLAWLHFYGEWPKGEIDHRDLNKANNAISNLRDASRSQNLGNRKVRSTSRIGLKGVYFDRRDGRWGARINVDGRQVALGRYATKEEAASAYADAAAKVFGEFARTA